MNTALEPAGAARLERHERLRIRSAALAAKRLYPGPVGELLAIELTSWEDFGYRLGRGQLIARLVDHLMKPPEPK